MSKMNFPDVPEGLSEREKSQIYFDYFIKIAVNGECNDESYVQAWEMFVNGFFCLTKGYEESMEKEKMVSLSFSLLKSLKETLPISKDEITEMLYPFYTFVIARDGSVPTTSILNDIKDADDIEKARNYCQMMAELPMGLVVE